MTLFARIEMGEIAEYRHAAARPDGDWRAVRGDPPPYDPEAEDLEVSQSIEPDGVVRVWTRRPALARLKAELKAAVDAAAEAIRARYVTPGSGQAMALIEKRDEAVRIAANPAAADALSAEQSAALYPILSAEIGIAGRATLSAVAAAVLAQAAAFREIERAINPVRIGAKAAIDAAATAADARAILAGLLWPPGP